MHDSRPGVGVRRRPVDTMCHLSPPWLISLGTQWGARGGAGDWARDGGAGGRGSQDGAALEEPWNCLLDLWTPFAHSRSGGVPLERTAPVPSSPPPSQGLGTFSFTFLFPCSSRKLEARAPQLGAAMSAEVKVTGQNQEQFLLLAKSAKGAALATLIHQVLEAPGVYVFGELLDMPNVREVCCLPG